MVTRRRSDADDADLSPAQQRRARTPQEREAQLVNLAYDLAERKIRNGTASSQEVTHFLKLGSSREFLEQERLRNENELTQAKIENLKSAARIEELYEGAIIAMRSYQGSDPLEIEGEVE